MKAFFIKLWKIIKLCWFWLVKSSANAQNTSLTIKSALYTLIPAILLVSGAYKLQLDNETLTNFIDQLCSLIIVIGGSITSIATILGGIRKIWKTLDGTNDVLSTYSK